MKGVFPAYMNDQASGVRVEDDGKYRPVYSVKLATAVHRYAVIIFSAGLLLAYTIIVWMNLETSKYFAIPWSWRGTFWDSGWWDGIAFSSASLPTDVLQRSGCSSGSITLSPEFTWSASEKSGVCKCLHEKFVTNYTAPADAGALQSTILRCVLGSKSSTEVGLFSEGSSFWVTNPIALVFLWNIVSSIADARYVRFERLESTGWEQIVYIFISLVLMVPLIACFFLTTVPVFIWYIAVVILFLGVVNVVSYLVGATRAGVRGVVNWIMYDWVFWLNYCVVFPIAVLLHNISAQKRDVMLNVVYVLIAGSIALSTMGANFFNKARGALQYAELSETPETAGIKQLMKKMAELGVNYDNISNYIVLCNLIAVAFLYQLSYPTFTLSFSTNLEAVSGLSVGILLVVVVLENSVAVRVDMESNIRVHRFRILLETLARTLVTGACILDVLAMRVF